MFDNFKRYPWVLPTHRYKGLDDLLKSLKERVIDPAEQKAKELAREKAKMLTSSLPNTYEPSLITQRKKALLVLAGGRALPDILALLYLRPEVVVVIMPQEGWPFQQVFADITRTLPSCEVKIIANVTAFDIDACMQACIEACLPYPDTGWDWTFTTSSSTKIMALAGYEIAKRKGIPCWQVDVLHEQVISFVRETEVDVQRFFRLTVDEYMINYGYAVDHYILRADYRDEFEACSDILRELIHSLDTPSFTTLLHDKPPGVQVPLFPATLVTSSLIQGLEACGAIKTKQKPDGTVTCEFTSKHFARFLGSGDWLEIYVWHEAKEAGFADDCQWAFQIIRGQVRFDIDLALTYKARLLIAECKTDYNPFMGKGVYLNTLDSNAHLFGGALVSKVFITNQPRTRGGFEAFHEQAKLRNIIVVTQEDLADIGAILKREVTNPTYVRI